LTILALDVDELDWLHEYVDAANIYFDAEKLDDINDGNRWK
jgi:hypothetical protein